MSNISFEKYLFNSQALKSVANLGNYLIILILFKSAWDVIEFIIGKSKL